MYVPAVSGPPQPTSPHCAPKVSHRADGTGDDDGVGDAVGPPPGPDGLAIKREPTMAMTMIAAIAATGLSEAFT